MTQNRAFSLPANLRRCLVDRSTGILSLVESSGGVTVSLQVADGALVNADGPALESSAAGSGPDRLRSLLVPLFALADVHSTFVPESGSEAPAARIGLADVLLEGIRSTKDTTRVSAWLGDRADVLELVPDPFAKFSESTLGPAEGYLLTRIDGPMSVQAMLDDAAVGPDLALRIVCGLRYADVLRPVDGSRPWVGDRGPFDGGRDTGAEPPPAVSSSDELTHALYLVEEKLRTVESGADHYAILEVERRATADRIKASYRELAKTFHPDRHAQLAAFDADIKSRLEVIFTALTHAYAALGNAKDREAYDAKLHKTDQASAVRAPAPSPVIPTPKPPAPKPPPPLPPPAEPKVAKGPVKPPMPIPVVPPLPLEPRRPPKKEKAPEKVTEAKPASPERAGKPEEPPVRPAAPLPKGPAPAPTVQPDALYDHGRAYAESGDWERAVQALKRGIEAAPEDARMHAKLGAALAALHGLNKLAEASLRKSLELDSTSADRFVEVAEVYLRFDRPDDAKRLFKRAFLIDSTNVEARAALGKLGVTGLGNDAQPGFFKRLFRKT